MSSVKRIICLSNSKKLGERCIAGIDVDTGNWIRPVCDELYPDDGKVPRETRLVEGREPQLLDILEIPLSSSGENFGLECENLSILPGAWKLIEKANPSEVRRFLRSYPNILHNSIKYVDPSDLRKLDVHQRRSLQLVEVDSIPFSREPSEDSKWYGSLTTSSGKVLEKLKITDPDFLLKLDKGHQPTGPFLVTVSLSMPHEPTWIPNWDKGPVCWKLIAGVIEIPSIGVQQSLDLGV